MAGKSYPAALARPFTPKQGRYLAFLYWYTKLNGRPPAEADLQVYFKTSPPTVHQMIVTLANMGLIERVPGEARSLRLLIPPEAVPDLETGEPPAGRGRSLSAAFPAVAQWIDAHEGYIEIGYDYNTDTFARALDEGGTLWGGGDRHMTLDEALQALDIAIDERRQEWE